LNLKHTILGAAALLASAIATPTFAQSMLDGGHPYVGLAPAPATPTQAATPA
jgi:hypothetical protein